MSNHTNVLKNETVIASLLDDLDTLAGAAKRVSERLLKVFPAKYGSNLWWKKEMSESMKQYEKGEYERFSSVDELMKDLNS